MVIHKSVRDFRLLRYNRRDGHAEGEHVNRGRETPSLCSTLQVLDMFTLGDAADVNPVLKFLPRTCKVCGRNLITGLTSATSPRVDIWSTCKVGHIFGVSLPLLKYSPSAWPQRSKIPEGIMSYPVLLLSFAGVQKFLHVIKWYKNFYHFKIHFGSFCCYNFPN